METRDVLLKADKVSVVFDEGAEATDTTGGSGQLEEE